MERFHYQSVSQFPLQTRKKAGKIMGHNLWKIRSRQHIRIKDLADHLKVTDSAIRSIEYGETYLYEERLKDIAEYFGVAQEEIIGEKDLDTLKEKIEHEPGYVARKLSEETGICYQSVAQFPIDTRRKAGRIMGWNLRQIRIKQNLALENLAHCLGVSQQAIHNAEVGQCYLSKDRLSKLADYLGVTEEEIIGEKDLNTLKEKIENEPHYIDWKLSGRKK